MKKRALTLLEVLIAFVVLAVLLGIFFPNMVEMLKFKKNLAASRAFVFSKAHVHERLAFLLSKTNSLTFNDQILTFQILDPNDPDPRFQCPVKTSLQLENGSLQLIFEGQDQIEKKETLIENVESTSFEFFEGGNNKLEQKMTWERGLPLFIKLTLKLNEKVEESFYFRLDGKHPHVSKETS